MVNINTVQRVCKDRVLFELIFRVTLMRAAANKMGAGNSSGLSTTLLWTSSIIQTYKQKSRGVRSGDSNR